MRNPQKRENKKAKQELPTLDSLNFPDTPKLTKPKATNKKALNLIAQGDYLWDKKRVERAAKKAAEKRRKPLENMNLEKHFLAPEVLNHLISLLPSWQWDFKTQSFDPINGDNFDAVSDTVGEDSFEELVWMILTLEDSPLPLKVNCLTFNQAAILEKALHRGSALGGTRVVVDEKELTAREIQAFIEELKED